MPPLARLQLPPGPLRKARFSSLSGLELRPLRGLASAGPVGGDGGMALAALGHPRGGGNNKTSLMPPLARLQLPPGPLRKARFSSLPGLELRPLRGLASAGPVGGDGGMALAALGHPLKWGS